MDKDIASAAVDYGRKLGAEYVEARIHSVQTMGSILRNGDPEPVLMNDSHGMAIRLIYKGAMSFVATNKLEFDVIKTMIANSLNVSRSSNDIEKHQIGLSDEKMGKCKWSANEKKRVEDRSLEELLKYLKDLDRLLENGFYEVNFPSRLLVISSEIEEKFYVNSDGADLESRVPRIEFSGYISSSYNGKIESLTIPPGYSQLGGTGGWEVLDSMDLNEYIPSKGKDLAKMVKSTGKPPKGELDIILGPEVMGLICHESSGHPGEADRVLGREAAQAGESYLKRDDFGLKIGSDEAYVSDDPTLTGSTGFYLYDDEGVKAEKRILINAGHINEYLHNRTTGKEFNKNSNASSRAMAYDREPIVRMSNTFVEPGDYSFKELIEDVKQGVYIKSFMEWNIDDKRFNQRYVGLESYLIDHGNVGEIVRNPVLEVTTPKFWSSIDARGDDLEFKTANCGKGDPMQGAPVWTGGPHVRLRRLKVGRR